MIDLETEKSATYVKEEIEKMFPMLDGKISVYKDHPIRPLNEVIEYIREKERHERYGASK